MLARSPWKADEHQGPVLEVWRAALPQPLSLWTAHDFFVEKRWKTVPKTGPLDGTQFWGEGIVTALFAVC